MKTLGVLAVLVAVLAGYACYAHIVKRRTGEMSESHWNTIAHSLRARGMMIRPCVSIAFT